MIVEKLTSISPSYPGIMFTLASVAIRLELILSPMSRIAFEFGPINVIPASVSAFAKPVFSDKNP